MQNIKKTLSAILTLAITASLLASCGASTTDSSQSTDGNATQPAADSAQPGAETSGKMEIEFFQTKGEAVDAWNVLINDYNASQSQYVVKQVNVPDAKTVLATRLASNDMPDITNRYPDKSEYHVQKEEGWYQDITDWEAMDNVVDSYREAVTIDGKAYCMPVSTNFMGVYYNEDLFKAAGYEIPKTWDEMMTIAKDIQSKGETAFILSNKDPWTMYYHYINILSKDKGTVYDGLKSSDKFTDPMYLSAFEKMKEMISYSQPETLSWGYDQAISDFANGKAYMFPQGSWVISSLKASNPDGNFKMFPMPNDSGDMKQILWVDIALVAGVNDNGTTEGIKDFFKFMSQPENAQKFSDLDGSNSCFKGVTAKLDYAQAVTDLINSNGILDVTYPYPSFIWENYIQKIVEGNPADLAAEVQQGWEEAAKDAAE